MIVPVDSIIVLEVDFSGERNPFVNEKPSDTSYIVWTMCSSLCQSTSVHGPPCSEHRVQKRTSKQGMKG